MLGRLKLSGSDAADQAITDQWNGKHWTISVSPDGFIDLNAVSCTTSTNCLVVAGRDLQQELAERWNGTKIDDRRPTTVPRRSQRPRRYLVRQHHQLLRRRLQHHRTLERHELVHRHPRVRLEIASSATMRPLGKTARQVAGTNTPRPTVNRRVSRLYLP
ncbi:MAG: hypothetical protein ACLPVY_12140 [Acidimicrobiia bacterium]